MSVGKLLHELRVAARVSLRDLGKQVDLSPVYLSDIEGGQRRAPAPAVIARIVDVLNTRLPDERKMDPELPLREALAERRTIELSLTDDTTSSTRATSQAEALLALARRWSDMDEEDLLQLTRLLMSKEEKD